MKKKACRTNEAAVCRNPVTIKKTTKDPYNDQTYESIKNIMSYSISLQVINKNAIIFYQKNMSNQGFRKSVFWFRKENQKILDFQATRY